MVMRKMKLMEWVINQAVMMKMMMMRRKMMKMMKRRRKMRSKRSSLLMASPLEISSLRARSRARSLSLRSHNLMKTMILKKK
jgi:hypothetical protein